MMDLVDHIVLRVDHIVLWNAYMLNFILLEFELINNDQLFMW